MSMSAARVLLATGAALLALFAIAPAAGAETTPMPARVEDVQYGSSPMQAANIYPAAAPNSPVVVLVHGGGWRLSAWLGYLELQAKSLQSNGFTVYEINYRQDTRTTPAFPMEPSDVVAATRWAISTASAYNGDPQRTFLVGGSAGAQLAALAAVQIDSETPGAVPAVVLLSTAGANFVTLKPLIETSALSSENFETSVERALAWNETAGAPFPQAYAERYSPVLHPPYRPDCPKWMLFNSAEELIPLAQAEELQRSLVSAGCSSSLTVVPGSYHAFAYFHIVKPQVYAFLKSVAG